MKVVLDANVFVSAAIQKGASHRIVQSWLAGTARSEVVMCPELLAEIRDVLTTRPRLRKWVDLDPLHHGVDATTGGCAVHLPFQGGPGDVGKASVVAPGPGRPSR